MIGDRGPKKWYRFDGDGCKAMSEKKTFCVKCIFKDDCPKERINEEKDVDDLMKARTRKHCPECGTTLTKVKDSEILECYLHGQFKENMRTGVIEPQCDCDDCSGYQGA